MTPIDRPSSHSEDPLSGLSFSLVGPGKVGRSMASWLSACGAQLINLGSRDLSQTLLGVESQAIDQIDTAEQDLLLLTVPAPSITPLARILSRRKQAAVVLHTSGAHGQELLAPLAGADTEVGSIHPLRAFAQSTSSLQDAATTFFAFDGGPRAETLVRSMVAAWSASAARIESAQRPLYYLAATLAAGGAATLTRTAIEIGRASGLPQAVVSGYLDLAGSALAAIPTAGAQSITGPVARGEKDYTQTLDLLHDAQPHLSPLVTLLALETIRQLTRENETPSRDQLRNELLRICKRPDFLSVLDR